VEKIEAAGGTVTRLREPVERKKKKHKAAAPVSDEGEVDEAEAETEVAGPEAAEGEDQES
jgi:hypothetical protein